MVDITGQITSIIPAGSMGNSLNMTYYLFIFLLILGALGVLIYYITNYLSYNIRVQIYKLDSNSFYLLKDKGRLKYDKNRNLASFRLFKRKVDLSTLINKTTSFVPIKEGFNYSHGIFLVQDGEDKEIDSYKIVNPKELKTFFDKGLQEAGVDSKISGASKYDWLLSQRMINELKPVPFWQNPIVGLVIQGFGIGAVVLILILGGRAINDILDRTNSVNEQTMQVTNVALRTLTDATNNLKDACLLGVRNVTRSNIILPT